MGGVSEIRSLLTQLYSCEGRKPAAGMDDRITDFQRLCTVLSLRFLALALVFSLAACNGGGSAVPSASEVAATAPLGNVRIAEAAGRVLFHEFKTECDTDKQNTDRDGATGETAFLDLAQDPIVYPGQANPPMQHTHTFWGNLAISPTATLADLMAAPSTCNMIGGHQAWWIPQASLDGVPVHPIAIVVYYKMGPDGFNDHVTPWTNGIRILAGKSSQSQADFAKIGNWTCGTLPRTSDVPDSCAPGTDLVLRLNGPHCMADLTQLDSPTHRTHIVYSVKGATGGDVCPADHPIAVPMPVWKISYAVTGGGLKNRLRFSAMRADGTVGPAGPAWSFHADEFFAFDMTRFAHLVDYCINGGRQCQHTGEGPHLTL